jgi:hypothetical protein
MRLLLPRTQDQHASSEISLKPLGLDEMAFPAHDVPTNVPFPQRVPELRRLPFLKRIFHALCFCVFAIPATSLAQHPGEDAQFDRSFLSTATPFDSYSAGFGGAAGGQVEPAAYSSRYLSRLAIRSGISTFGVGASLATNLPYRLDLRVFGNYTDFDWKLNESDFYVIVNIGMANAGALVDYYPWKRLRISPGLLFYNTNRLSATLQAQPGATFTLNNVTYTSDDANPIHGTGGLSLGGRGFMATSGWGNIVSRNEKRWHFPFEAGAAFIDKPIVNFSLQGNICEGGVCVPATTFPDFQSNLNAQLSDWNRRVAPFHIYPFIQGGLSYTFRYRR